MSKKSLELLEYVIKNYDKIKKMEETCQHQWEGPIYSPEMPRQYDPNIFGGKDRWLFYCKICGKKVYSYCNPLNSTLKR
jgi:hypothetical protein